MATPMASRHLHLELHRPLILERAAVAQAAALLPVPIVDDLLADAARATLLRKIAAARGVGADEAALSILSRVVLAGDSLPSAAANQLTRRLLRRTFRRLAVALHLAGHAGDFATTVALATLFDHYCVRHHVGLGLDRTRGHLLAGVIERAVADARLAMARRGFDRAVHTASDALLLAPRALRSLVARASGVPLLTGGGTDPARPPDQSGAADAAAPADPAEPVDPAEASRAPAGNVAQRALAAVAELLSDTGRAWIEELTSAFDARWAARSGDQALS